MQATKETFSVRVHEKGASKWFEFVIWHIFGISLLFLWKTLQMSRYNRWKRPSGKRVVAVIPLDSGLTVAGGIFLHQLGKLSLIWSWSFDEKWIFLVCSRPQGSGLWGKLASWSLLAFLVSFATATSLFFSKHCSCPQKQADVPQLRRFERINQSM